MMSLHSQRTTNLYVLRMMSLHPLRTDRPQKNRGLNTSYSAVGLAKLADLGAVCVNTKTGDRTGVVDTVVDGRHVSKHPPHRCSSSQRVETDNRSVGCAHPVISGRLARSMFGAAGIQLKNCRRSKLRYRHVMAPSLLHRARGRAQNREDRHKGMHRSGVEEQRRHSETRRYRGAENGPDYRGERIDQKQRCRSLDEFASEHAIVRVRNGKRI